MLSIIMLSVVMLNVVMLSVIMLNVVAPFNMFNFLGLFLLSAIYISDVFRENARDCDI